ncbi:MAG: trypsin-like peptidase domain-containing protein [Planctomycetes bacterium]|nr:trypsin-like peptidase domain-containing protein [Planctomycetota bacterium]
MPRLILLFAVAAMAFAPSPRCAAQTIDPAVLAAQRQRIEIVERVAPSVVAIFSAGGQGGGSGVIISPDGFALTNFHVTSGAGTFMKCGINDGKLYDAVIVGIDPTGDVAMIKLQGRDDFPTAKLGDSDKLKPGDWTFAMGNPFLLATDFQPTVTYGIISGVHRYQYPAGTFLEYTDCIQVDTSINPGNSGGPLFNADGELVGINGRGSFEKRGRVNSGAGYAISINQIKHFMDHLRGGRIVDHASLGAAVSTSADGSIVVSEILLDSEASRRGLQVGDEIVAFGGRSIRSVNQYKNILGIYPKGWKIPLLFRHEGQKYEITVRLRGLHRSTEMTPGKRRPQRGKKKTPKKSQVKPPEHLKKLYIKKEGYANYYFNKLEQDRMLKNLQSLGNFEEVKGTWKLTGKTDSGDAFKFLLNNEAVTLEIGEDLFAQDLLKDPADEPPGSGGLLVAMSHLRMLLTERGVRFSEFYYLGSEPLDGPGEQVDVLVSELTGARSRWYFSQKNGAFVGFDMQLSEDVDECEIRFADFREFNGRQLPGTLIVRRGSETLMTLQLEQAELSGGT